MANFARRQRGFTLIEGVVATFILAVVIVAMFGSWSACFSGSAIIAETTSAANICQADIEIAKTFGAQNIPTGTYSSSTQTGTWTGAYIPSTGWTSGATAYYNFGGTQLASSTSAGVFYSLSITITDTNVLQGSGTSYTLQPTSNRAMVVTVTNTSTGVVDFSMAINLVENGV